MKNSRKAVPAVNAGSMADIAFLLLIFFLVTTTISDDTGIMSILPKPCPPNIDCTGDIKERNIFSISLNKDGEILVNEEEMQITALREAVKSFIDNNGNKTCTYCQGNSDLNLSEHPLKAIIALQSDREAAYDTYISIQNELVGAYYDLRKAYATNTFNVAVEELNKDQLKKAKEAYPLLISEAKTQ